MSMLFENKQIIHIASEILILLGLTFYFNQKNKKLLGYIEDLSQRVETQEDLLQKHEEIIKKLVDYINNIQKSENIVKTTVQKPKSKSPLIPSTLPTPPTRQAPTVRQARQAPLSPPSSLKSSKVTFQQENELDEDSDLDAELSEELEELNEQESDMEEFGMD